MDERHLPTTGDEDNKTIPLGFDRIMDALNHGKIEAEHGLIRWSSNHTFLTSVCHDDLEIHAVYKPRSGERPLWDFPDGTLCYRERAAFVTSEALGWSVVPPTALREGPRGLGSLQFFIDHDPEYNYFEFKSALLPQLERLALFDVIINNADRKGGHCIVDAANHVWGIDHGITFNAAHKLRTVIWNFSEQSIPEKHINDLTKLRQCLDDENASYTQAMTTLISIGEMAAFKRRIDKLLTTKIYPSPGPGPNYPWPPV
jgi:hypothetical protein